MILLTNGYVHPVDAPDIPRGFVAFSQGKITAVGTMDRLSADLDGERYDLKGAHICPGFVDAHCHLGLFGNALGFEGEDGNEATDPVTPHLRALDAVNPQDRYFAEARCAGVTTVLTCPGSANPVSGQGVILKTAGRWVDEMVLSASACMKFALGENPKAVYSDRKEGPVTRMATAALIRESLAQAREYGEKKERSRVDPEEDAPEFDAKCEALLPVLSGQVKAHFHAHRADDIATALRISREFGLRPVIVHATEGHLIGELLEREQVPVITGPCRDDPGESGDPGPAYPNGDLHRPPGDPHPVPPPVRRHGGAGRAFGTGRFSGHYPDPGKDLRGGRPGGLHYPGEGRRPGDLRGAPL
jgi:imidazolonepropionase-like amidohydrolase